MNKQTWRQWVRAVERDVARGDAPPGRTELFRGCLAPLTGQDARTLDAIAACWELYSLSDYAGQAAALAAVRTLLPAMQAHLRWLAKELIPFAMNWKDRERLWPLVTKPADAPERYDEFDDEQGP